MCKVGCTRTRTLTHISAASAVYSCPSGTAGTAGTAPLTLQGTGIGSVCRAIIGATPIYACPAGYSAQSAGCVSTATNGASLQAGSVRYFHTDHLGSVTAITDETGLVVERLAYDAWGKRRFTNGTADVNDTVVGLTTDRGYTEHEMLDELGIIHMNGRVYDPTIGRFMSADPFIQAPYELQSHNRYAYVMNNPLLYTDPSGYFSFRSFFTAIVVIVAVVATMGAVAVAVGAASSFSMMATAWTVTTLGQAVAIGAAAGFVGGFLGAALNGASFGDSLKAGVIGGITGAAMAWAGGVGGIGEAGSNSAARYMAHAAVGCGSSVASGGGASGCGRGAAAALIGHAVTNYSAGQGDVARFAAATVSGGVTSRVMGGSFANGATTAAYGFLFNELLHRDWGGSNEQRLKNSAYKESRDSDGNYYNIQTGKPYNGESGDVQVGMSLGFTAVAGGGGSVDTGPVKSSNGQCAIMQTTCGVVGPIAGYTIDATVINYSGGSPSDGWNVSVLGKLAIPIFGLSAAPGYGSDGFSFQLSRSWGEAAGVGLKMCTQRVVGKC